MQNKNIIIASVLGVLIIISSVIFFNHEYLRENIFGVDNDKNFKIELANQTCTSADSPIYNGSSNLSIISRCDEIYYSDNKNKIPLGEAIEKDIIRIKDIYNKMEVYDAVFDGGTTIYEYNKKSNTLSNSSFRLEVCNKINGKRDQLFLSIHSNNYKCA